MLEWLSDNRATIAAVIILVLLGAYGAVLQAIHEHDLQLLMLYLERSIQPDSTLSADIARKNYDQVAQGEGRERLEARIDDIKRERDEAYAPFWPAD